MMHYLAATTVIVIVTSTGIATAEEINNINNPGFLNSSASSRVNENFEINIDSERIIEQDYKSSMSIRFGEDSPRSISLQIGSVVRAQKIDMHLQNIHGQVNFRGSWEPILQKLRSRRSVFGTQSNQ